MYLAERSNPSTSDAKRRTELEGLKTECPDLAANIRVEQGEANEEIQKICAKDWSAHRAVLFLDPYGMQVEWQTIEAVAKTKALDLGPLRKLKLKNIDWVIVGGESGHCARPMDPAWVTDIRDQCARAGVAFFFKQWGGKNKKKAGRVLDGRTYDEMPDTAPVARAPRAQRSLPMMG